MTTPAVLPPPLACSTPSAPLPQPEPEPEPEPERPLPAAAWQPPRGAFDPHVELSDSPLLGGLDKPPFRRPNALLRPHHSEPKLTVVLPSASPSPRLASGLAPTPTGAAPRAPHEPTCALAHSVHSQSTATSHLAEPPPSPTLLALPPLERDPAGSPRLLTWLGQCLRRLEDRPEAFVPVAEHLAEGWGQVQARPGATDVGPAGLALSDALFGRRPRTLTLDSLARTLGALTPLLARPLHEPQHSERHARALAAWAAWTHDIIAGEPAAAAATDAADAAAWVSVLHASTSCFHWRGVKTLAHVLATHVDALRRGELDLARRLARTRQAAQALEEAGAPTTNQADLAVAALEAIAPIARLLEPADARWLAGFVDRWLPAEQPLEVGHLRRLLLASTLCARDGLGPLAASMLAALTTALAAWRAPPAWPHPPEREAALVCRLARALQTSLTERALANVLAESARVLRQRSREVHHEPMGPLPGEDGVQARTLLRQLHAEWEELSRLRLERLSAALVREPDPDRKQSVLATALNQAIGASQLGALMSRASGATPPVPAQALAALALEQRPSNGAHGAQ